VRLSSHDASQVLLRVGLLHDFALVVQLSALAEPDQDFGLTPLVEVKLQRNQRQPFLSGGGGKFVHFLTMQ
jgi:hypothetical protein